MDKFAIGAVWTNKDRTMSLTITDHSISVKENRITYVVNLVGTFRDAPYNTVRYFSMHDIVEYAQRYGLEFVS